ncbi:PREDICTED: uncharacterized protein LOC107352021 isoform X1 [Acropora digitifera]|uniref:uncharacterized protein LOC107352021 isoform X1 n=1 Tax=Acropora digitifera TaxID=70779 RepID=UPI00077AA274|nr:PREDICTED: uncharacterized protein LOC107352021 isoform X1 [Acropora digitifera]
MQKKTIFAKVLRKTVVIVDICVHPECLKKTLKENKWFTDEHLSRLVSKLEDVILARVLAPPETGKKKSGRNSRYDRTEVLPDPELCVNYQFVKRRKCKQMILIKSQQGKQSKVESKTSKNSAYSGGGYETLGFFSEKLEVSVKQVPADELCIPLASGVIQGREEEKPSAKSKYFNRDVAEASHSTQKRRAVLKNMNKKSDSQKKIDSLLSTTSSNKDAWNSAIKRGKSPNCEDVTIGSQCSGTQIQWLNDAHEALEIQNEEGLENDKEGEQGRDCSLKSGKDTFSRKLPNKNLKRYGKNSCDEKLSLNEGVTGGLSGQEYPETEAKPKYKNNADETERIVNACKTVTYSRTSNRAKLDSNDIKEDDNSNQETSEESVAEHKKSKVKASNAKKLKRPRTNSESTSTSDYDSGTSLRSRLQASKISVKKQKTTRMETSTESQKETDSDGINVAEDDWDFEPPKVRRNVEKRKGVNPSDDQELYVHNSNIETAGNSDSTENENSCSKRRKTNSSAASDVSKRKNRKQESKKSSKAPLKTTRTLPTDILEDLEEEPGSSPFEPISVEDMPAVAIDVSCIEELSLEQTEQLVWQHAEELRKIFEGKVNLYF